MKAFRQKNMWLIVLAVLLAEFSAPADPVAITLDYRIPCEQAVQTMALGAFTATPHDTTDNWIEANFAVNNGVQKGQPGSQGIWNCMELHWLQTIWHLDTTDFTITGAQPQLQIIDLPLGGWDNMYKDLDSPHDGIQNDERIPANVNNPIWADDSRDTDPWYWTSEEEVDEVNEGVSYSFSDQPIDLNAPNYMGFSTYLCAIVTQVCPSQPSECLNTNEMLVLGGFDWTDNTDSIDVQNTFANATAGDIAEISVALKNAGFSGWSVTRDKDICCIPEPSTIILLSIACGIFGFMRCLQIY